MGELTEGSEASTSSPAAALEGAELKNVTGSVTISQQLQERAAVVGGEFDVIVSKQLHEQWEEKCEKLVLNAVYATATTVTGASSYKTKNLYEDVGHAREEIADTAGTRLRATHLFTTHDLFSFATRQVDGTTERPVLVPSYAPGFPLTKNADDFDSGPDPAYARFTGVVMPGNLLWMTSDAIEALGTTSKTRLIVSACDASIVYGETEPLTSVFPETKATNLQVHVNLRSYAFAITRHASGSSVILGNAYTTSEK